MILIATHVGAGRAAQIIKAKHFADSSTNQRGQNVAWHTYRRQPLMERVALLRGGQG